MDLHAEPYFLKNRPAELGESATLTSFGLVQVSIPEAAVLLLDPKSPDTYREIICDHGDYGAVGSAVESRHGTLLAATSKGLIELKPDDLDFKRSIGLPRVSRGEFASADNMQRVRFNDGKVGPNGRIYFGVIFDHKDARSSRTGQGCVVSVGPAGDWKECITGVSTPNGGVWNSVDGPLARFYLSDSPTKKIHVYHHNLVEDSFEKVDELDLTPSIWNENAEKWGRPDGMTVGLRQSGAASSLVLLVAMYSGGSVVVLDPSKKGPDALVATIRISTPNVTSVALLGNFAFITTGKSPGSPHGGMTYRVDLSSVGISEVPLPKAW